MDRCLERVAGADLCDHAAQRPGGKPVQRYVLPGLNNDPEPVEYLEGLVEQGQLGYKTGTGFYDWKVKDMKALAVRRDCFIIETLRTLKAISNTGECDDKRSTR